MLARKEEGENAGGGDGVGEGGFEGLREGGFGGIGGGGVRRDGRLLLRSLLGNCSQNAKE